MGEKMDYLKLWEEQFLAAHGCQRRASQYYDDPANAARYDDSQPIRLDGERRAAAFGFEADATVLDIGPGPGTLALPLAPRVAQITAVEPSAGMRALLARHSQEQGVKNLRILPTRWEDADPQQVGVHDYVVASYSLNMPQIGPALQKMNDLARKQVILYWFNGLASWEKLKVDLLPQTLGRAFQPQPKSDLLYGCLCQLGISAQVIPLTDTEFSYDYPTMEAAVDNLRGRLGLSGGFDALLSEYIQAHYSPLPGGGWRFQDHTQYVRLQWTKEGAQ